MEELKQLNLTERDFELLVEGLEELPNKGMAGEFMADLFKTILTKDDDGPSREQILKDRERKNREKEGRDAMLKEDIRILQGKLLMLKRLLIEQGALRHAYGIINNRNESF